MGIFAKFRPQGGHAEQLINEALVVEDTDDNSSLDLETQMTVMFLVLSTLLVCRFATRRQVQNIHGEHLLDMSNLNDAANFKEVFLCYLQASVLEPVLAIGGMERAQDEAAVINLLTLASICWWIWLITDAFDFADVMQRFKYSNELREDRNKDPDAYQWLLLSDVSEDAEQERKTLQGSLARDVGLWFMMASIAAAWLPGAVTHRDVLHAYVVVILWTIQHWLCRRATAWTASPVVTYFFPSTALMPLEYCLPLMDVADTVEDLEFLVNYREFTYRRTGVELIIQS
uniref:Uncharacterized protein n=1 Tax=Amphora coffeiformis TaxID=265554 RepID=A0A6S8P6F7_9STRA|mmetsp:Transcript_3134/g.5993  ORF Transcript_3134/g.5993 Transcript_3134/m.5993 type:complete len:287 (+) Transcript_3134:114-974(+)